MRILERNINKKTNKKDFEYIPRHHVYVRVLDHGPLFLILKEIIIETGSKTWTWIFIKEDIPIDISEVISLKKTCSFDNAINRAVNDPYSTVYEFENYKEMIEKWKEIAYKDEIKTIYISEKKEN